ncbi:MAG: helix-turn-helix domain-containing protein [Burkholderiales bacterium]
MNASIPNYALYGDEAVPSWIDLVHMEQIHERSSIFNFEIDPHVHHGLIQVLYLTRGGGDVFVDNRQWTIRAPAVIVVPTRHVHGFRFSPDVDGPVVTAAQHPLESVAAVAAPGLLRHIREPRVMEVAGSPRHADALLPLFDAIDREGRIHVSGESAAGTVLLMAVFVQISRIVASMRLDEDEASAERSKKAARVERFRATVDLQFRNRWPVARYASDVGLSVGQLSRICRELLGGSAIDVLNARIVHEAERELVYSTLSVKQIAGLVGFDDEAYFGRFFKKQTNLTPTEFREAARRQLAHAVRLPAGGA